MLTEGFKKQTKQTHMGGVSAAVGLHEMHMQCLFQVISRGIRRFTTVQQDSICQHGAPVNTHCVSNLALDARLEPPSQTSQDWMQHDCGICCLNGGNGLKSC